MWGELLRPMNKAKPKSTTMLSSLGHLQIESSKKEKGKILDGSIEPKSEGTKVEKM